MRGKGPPFGQAYGHHTLPGEQGLSKSLQVVPDTLPPLALFVSGLGGYRPGAWEVVKNTSDLNTS